MPDNYVIREKFNGLIEVDGQLVPQSTQVQPEELIQSTPEYGAAVRNGGGGKRGGKVKSSSHVIGESGPC